MLYIRDVNAGGFDFGWTWCRGGRGEVSYLDFLILIYYFYYAGFFRNKIFGSIKLWLLCRPCMLSVLTLRGKVDTGKRFEGVRLA